MSTAHDDAPRGFVPMADYLRLQRKCDELEATVAELREDRADALTEERELAVRLGCGLTRQQSRLVLTLLSVRHPLKGDVIIERISPDASPHTVATIASYANTRLRKRGLPNFIRGMSGCQSGGYILTPEGRAWLTEHIPELFTGARP